MVNLNNIQVVKVLNFLLGSKDPARSKGLVSSDRIFVVKKRAGLKLLFSNPSFFI